MGLGRNLTPEEISEQLLRLARLLRDEQDARISNVVMMGMGEPFHNYDNVLAAIRDINAPERLRPRRAPDRDLHRRLDPGDRQARRRADAGQARALAARARRRAAHEADAGHEALSGRRADAGLPPLPRATRRRVFVEYLLLAGVNDGTQQARQLAALLRRAARARST